MTPEELSDVPCKVPGMPNTCFRTFLRHVHSRTSDIRKQRKTALFDETLKFFVRVRLIPGPYDMNVR